jgi:hypothetical protein
MPMKALRATVTAIALFFAVALAVAAAPGSNGAVLEAGELPLLFDFGVRPLKLSPKKPKPVRVLVSGKYETGDGSHVSALDELVLELDRHLKLEVRGVPVCGGGTRSVRGEVLEGCEDAVVGKGAIEAEVAFPEAPIFTVSGTLTVYNRGRKPGGADLAGYAYFPAPITGAVLIPIKVRKNAGRYGWRVRFEIPKIAGGAGSITAYSARLWKRIFSATCDGRMVARAVSTFVDGTTRTERAMRTCVVAEADVRQ